ncbi:SAV_915 family protein [Streptomyces albipurpureus]|uniref:SseB protein N-terminal domain-containing protein n=1 Tax=Streptomyces albipurpureus TaxID=2897419 RepID=A0ABT0UZM8_9ACTN|nr:SAV_915 family protein [Streptomyces sp. CWNU-1]MCM2392768.1 hypothetical protein [Streptomyces sp. CWNU-1]
MYSIRREESDGGDPEEPRPTGPLYVPVRLGSLGGRQLCFMRTPLGVRTAVGFTSGEQLAAVLGAGQQWIRLAEPVLRELAEPLGVLMLTVDPQLTAPGPARPATAGPRVPLCARRRSSGELEASQPLAERAEERTSEWELSTASSEQ